MFTLSNYKFYLVCVFASILFLACGGDENLSEIIRPVRTEQVFSTGGKITRTFSGTVQSGKESKLSFKVAGTVQDLQVEIGSKVRKGDLLIQLDPTDYEIRVKEAENARDLARASEIQATSNYERVRILYETRSASKSSLDAARAAYESAHEQDNIAKKRRKLARNQLEYTSLRAPADGAISDIMCEENENVQMGHPVLVLTSGTDLEVKIAMPEVLISRVSEGHEVIVTLEALKNKKFKAKISEVGVASVGYMTTYPVMLKFTELDPDILPGMAAEVMMKFESDIEGERYIVPLSSVGEDRSGRFVYVVLPIDDTLGIVHKKTVKIGELSSEGLEILEGLEDGEHLVTAGVSRIQDSLKVKFTKPE